MRPASEERSAPLRKRASVVIRRLDGSFAKEIRKREFLRSRRIDRDDQLPFDWRIDMSICASQRDIVFARGSSQWQLKRNITS